MVVGSQNMPWQAEQHQIRIDSHRSQRGWFELSTEQVLPAPRDRVFAMFADAFELERITPPWLKFRVVTPAPILMATGTLIDYRLRLHGIPLRWRTRIAAWEPNERFVDEQLRGPYRVWRHEHRFFDVADGTRVVDRVEYRVLGGAMVHRLLVRSDLLTIFAYRRVVMAQIFGKAN